MVAAPGGIDVAPLKLAPAAPLQAAVQHLLDDSTPVALLAPIRLFQEGRLNYLSLGSLSASPGAPLLSHAFRIVLLHSFEVVIFCLQERGGDAFLEDPFSLARPAGKLIFLLERLDEVAQVGTYGVAHLQPGMVLMAVGAGYAAFFVVAESSLAMMAPLLEVVVAIHIH